MSKRLKRLLAGNPELARSITKYIKQRNKITRLEWTNTIRPLMRNAQNAIQQQIINIPASEWQLFNLRRITESIGIVINNFETQFATSLIGEQGVIAQVASDATISQAPLVGLTSSVEALIGTELIQTLTPLTRNLVNFFADDMAKVIGGSISNSLITGQSPGQAVIDLRSKFGIEKLSHLMQPGQ